MKSNIAYVLMMLAYSCLSIAVFLTGIGVWSVFSGDREGNAINFIYSLVIAYTPAVVLYLVSLFFEYRETFMNGQSASEALKVHERRLAIAALVFFGSTIGFVAVQAYLADRASRAEVAQRESIVVPDANDLTTWALRDKSLLEESRTYESNDKSQKMAQYGLSTSTQYGVTKENLINGKIGLTTIKIDPSDKDRKYNGFGAIVFTAASASTCYPSEHNSYYTCNDFEPGVLKVLDFVAMPSEFVEGYSSIAGVALVERTLDATNDLMFMVIHNNAVRTKADADYIDNLYSANLYNIPDVDQESFTNIEISEVNRPFESSYLFGKVRLSGDGIQNQYVMKIVSVPHGGPTASFSQYDSDIFTDSYSVRDYQYIEGEPVWAKVGALHLKHKLDDYWSNMWYARGQLYRDSGVSEPKQLYHKNVCGQPYTFSDTVINIEGVTSRESRLNLRLEFALTNTKESLNLTTSKYGYDPEQWGTVVDTINVDSYINTINSGISFNGLDTELVTINGVPVRHTLPYNPPRPCDSKTYEQYQWVRDGDIYSLDISYEREVGTSPDERAFVDSALKALVEGVSYVPAE